MRQSIRLAVGYTTKFSPRLPEMGSVVKVGAGRPGAAVAVNVVPGAPFQTVTSVPSGTTGNSSDRKRTKGCGKGRVSTAQQSGTPNWSTGTGTAGGSASPFRHCSGVPQKTALPRKSAGGVPFDHFRSAPTTSPSSPRPLGSESQLRLSQGPELSTNGASGAVKNQRISVVRSSSRKKRACVV